jgi:hypothetical protein
VGFNATRRYRDDKRRDIAMGVAAIVVVALLIAWAMGVF